MLVVDDGIGGRNIIMETKIVNIINEMAEYLDAAQLRQLQEVLLSHLADNAIEKKDISNSDYLKMFLEAKAIEGCSERTINYYGTTIEHLLITSDTPIRKISTEELRSYLVAYQKINNCSKTTVDNIRRNLSSFFSWLEEENYILNLLYSTGIRVGELVNINIEDVDFEEREIVVFGKGDKERRVYFDARTKVHLRNYLDSRIDTNNALFVTLDSPYDRLKISGVEIRLRQLGRKLDLEKIHPHKFRRTMATRAIDKGMPIEQVQKILGHSQIDTTMEYAIVNQKNVKLSHRRFIA